MKLIQAAMTKIDQSREQIMEMVNQDILAEIKKYDPEPTLMAFSIAHEGVGRPNVVGEGPTEIVWDRHAVESMTDRLQMNTPLYGRHPKFQGEQRAPLAQVVGKGNIEASNGLNSVAVAYVPKQNKAEAEKADFASIEAEVEFGDPPASMATKIGRLFVKAVEAISGIAIGMREKFKPGFPESQKLASITAYIYAYDEEQTMSNNQINWREINPMDVPWDFITQALKVRNATFPSVWNVDEEILPHLELDDKGDIVVRTKDQQINKLIKKMSDHIKPVAQKQAEERFMQEIGMDSESLKKALSELSSMKTEKLRNEAIPKIEELAKEAGLDQVGINFIKKQAESLTDFSDESKLSEFVQSKVGDWEQIAGPIKKPEPAQQTTQPTRPALGPQGAPPVDVPSWAKDIPESEL